MSRNRKRANGQRSRALRDAANYRQLGQVRGRRRKRERQPVRDTAAPQPPRRSQPATEPAATPLAPADLVHEVERMARQGVYDVATIAERLDVPETRVKAAVHTLAERTHPS